MSNHFALLRAKIRRLPPVHQAVLRALVEHLQRVTARKEKNKMDPKNLAIVFGSVIFGEDELPQAGDLLSVQHWKVDISLARVVITADPCFRILSWRTLSPTGTCSTMRMLFPSLVLLLSLQHQQVQSHPSRMVPKVRRSPPSSPRVQCNRPWIRMPTSPFENLHLKARISRLNYQLDHRTAFILPHVRAMSRRLRNEGSHHLLFHSVPQAWMLLRGPLRLRSQVNRKSHQTKRHSQLQAHLRLLQLVKSRILHLEQDNPWNVHSYYVAYTPVFGIKYVH